MGLWDCSRNLGESLHLLSSLILSKPLARPQLFGACLTTHVPSLLSPCRWGRDSPGQ